MDQTALIFNVKQSFKKYMVDNIDRIEGLRVSFDMDIAPPEKQGVPFEEWVSVNYGASMPDTVSAQMIKLTCCTRRDQGGTRLAQIRDIVMGYLIDRRITLYNASEWKQVGSMLVFIDAESGEQRAEDGTKYWIISINLRWGTKF